MCLEFDGLLSARAASSQAPTPLPGEIAFLEGTDVPSRSLRAAVARAAGENVPVEQALIADETVGDDKYYRRLAQSLGVPFVKHWPQLVAPNPALVIAQGRVRLGSSDGGRLLMAPTGGALRILLQAHRLQLPLDEIALTTPNHLAEIILRREDRATAHVAAWDLPEAAPRLSAHGAFNFKARLLTLAMISACLLGGWFECRLITDVLGVLFLASMLLRIRVCLAGVEPSIAIPQLVEARNAPTYTVLVALYNEPAVAPTLVAALKRLDYPRTKLEILLLLEADDAITLRALHAQGLPPHMRVVVVPDGKPRTKPRALNVGLMLAKGALITVYDAEDRPDPLQLRKAAAAFAAAPADVACLQARLVIGNGARGLLPRLFALEYAGLFDIFNIGIGRLGLPMALGGTSNHFRTAILREMYGWDAWNVTEDADLGFRLARFGYRTRSLDSDTLEDAPLDRGVWFKQRRRWMKGWMQTLLVLAREPRTLRDFGAKRYVVLALLLTNLVTGPLALPFFQALMLLRFFVWGASPPDTIAAQMEVILGVGVAALGIFATGWCGYLGLRARRLEAFWPALPLLYVYQLMISAATWMGLWDLVWRPYHWHKTEHAAATPVADPVHRADGVAEARPA